MISYTIDLDRAKGDSGSDSFRRMFFVDDITKNRVFTISGVYNSTKLGGLYCSSPRTVYLKVRHVSYIELSYRLYLSVSKYF